MSSRVRQPRRLAPHRGVPYRARLQIGLRRPSFEIPGSDFAGVVKAVGPTVTTVRPGDQVYGTTFMAGFGAFAERVAVPERLLTHRPRTVSFQHAAAVPLAASTALQAVRDHGKVQPGHRVLIIGASGGVGTYAIQLAKHLGAKVTGVCSTNNVEFVRSLGADHVIDYTNEHVTETTDRYELVVQVAGTHSAGRLRRLLTPNGTLVQLSGDSSNRWIGPVGRIIAGRLLSVITAQTVISFTVQPNRDDLSLLASLIDRGALRTQLDRTYALDHIADALGRVESGRTRGKVAVTVAPNASGLAADGSDTAAGPLR